jgi:hypothetical protein
MEISDQLLSNPKSLPPEVLGPLLQDLRSRAQNLFDIVRAHGRLTRLKSDCTQRNERTKKVIKRTLKLKRELTNLKEQHQLHENLVNKTDNLEVTSEEVILYASKISNFIQGYANFRVKDAYLPWSFGANKVELPEIEASGLYAMYKNNPSYLQLLPPRTVFLEGSDNNLIDRTRTGPHELFVVAKGTLKIGIQVEPGESFMYTLDGREPNQSDKYDYSQNDKLAISSDKVLKIKAFRPGFIDSPTVILHVKMDENPIVQGGSQAFDQMVKPEEIKNELYDDFNGYEDLFDNDGGFTSLHMQGPYSTPGT